jgi:hypothetical protein
VVEVIGVVLATAARVVLVTAAEVLFVAGAAAVLVVVCRVAVVAGPLDPQLASAQARIASAALRQIRFLRAAWFVSSAAPGGKLEALIGIELAAGSTARSIIGTVSQLPDAWMPLEGESI